VDPASVPPSGISPAAFLIAGCKLDSAGPTSCRQRREYCQRVRGSLRDLKHFQIFVNQFLHADASFMDPFIVCVWVPEPMYQILPSALRVAMVEDFFNFVSFEPSIVGVKAA
jgi:hypothetical protein